MKRTINEDTNITKDWGYMWMQTIFQLTIHKIGGLHCKLQFSYWMKTSV